MQLHVNMETWKQQSTLVVLQVLCLVQLPFVLFILLPGSAWFCFFMSGCPWNVSWIHLKNHLVAMIIARKSHHLPHFLAMQPDLWLCCYLERRNLKLSSPIFTLLSL